MKKQHSLLLLIFLLAVILIVLLMLLPHVGRQNPTVPTDSTQASAETTPSTQVTTPSTAPTSPTGEATQPGSQPTDPSGEATQPSSAPTRPTESTGPAAEIGSIYTRAELEAMDTTVNGYGPGKTSGGKRAPYAESDQKKYGQYGANFIAPDNGNIYLTFDCGYEYYSTGTDGKKYRNTERILDVLKEKNVKAVFFVTMPYVKDEADLVQRMIDEGHVVGNHSNHHPVMPEQTIDKMVDEVMSLHDYVLEHFGYEMTLFRPPTGAFSVQSLAVVQNLGYKNVHWSFAYYDYDTEDQMDVASAYERVTSSHHSGAIYLLHAISTTNAALLPDAIDFFRAEGYNLELFR